MPTVHVFRPMPVPPPPSGTITQATWDMIEGFKENESLNGAYDMNLEMADIGWLSGMAFCHPNEDVRRDCYNLIHAIQRLKQVELDKVYE